MRVAGENHVDAFGEVAVGRDALAVVVLIGGVEPVLRVMHQGDGERLFVVQARVVQQRHHL